MEEWLRSIQLGRYVDAFRREGVTLDQRALLTEADLRELGLTLGDRKRYAGAVAALQAASFSSPVATERRPLTVMFVDLVGSTTLGERLDAEDLMEVLRDYRDRCGTAIRRYGGRIARFLGDGILAYFGYPSARENDPERACRAALDIVAAVGGLATPDGEPIALRIGLASGMVIVGDLIAGGEIDSHSVVGSTPNLAARLQSLAPPNGIVVSEQTRDRVRRHIAGTAMPPIQLKGFARTHVPWLITGELVSRGRLPRGSQATPLVGRDAEVETLRALWRRADRGNGNIALLLGEPGIGKSRLIRHFVDEDLPESAGLAEIHGSAFDADSPLRPFIDYVSAEAGLAIATGPEDALHRLGRIAGADTMILADLMGVDRPAQPARLTPEQLRERTIAALARLPLRAEAPVCVLVEDLHWLDPTSCEVLSVMARGIGSKRCLLLIGTRDEADLSWLPQESLTTLRLRRLDADQAAMMVGHLLEDRSAPASLVALLASRADGVPLFIEEIARTLIERGDLGTGEPLDEGSERDIPVTLQESLMARLDRAGPAKHAAQIAAVIGRAVRRDLLAAASGTTNGALDGALARLVSTGVLEHDYRAPSETYVFTHSLLRDAAYDSLLREPQRSAHEQVARALQRIAPVPRQPDILAMHLTAAGHALEAAPLWLEAAQASLSRSALTEAARLLRRGLSALEKLPISDAEAMRLRLRLSGPLGAALMGLKGPFSPETQEHYARAYELFRTLPEEEAHFPIYWGWWRVAPDYGAHLARAGSLLERAAARGDKALLLQAHHCNWAINFHIAELDRCRGHMREGLAIYEAGEYRNHARLYGNHDAKVCAHGGLCQLLWMQGNLLSAEREETACLAWAERIDHLGSRVHALDLTLLYRAYRRDYDAVLARADALLALTTEYGLVEHQAAGTIFRGWVIASRGEPRQGLAMIEDGFARQREVASTEDFPVYLCLLAEVLTALGRADEAVQRLTQERAALDRIGLRLWVPELLRVTAETMLIVDPGASGPVDGLLTEAERMAAAQGVHMLRLRIARSRARRDPSQAAQCRLEEALRDLPEPDASAELAEINAMLATTASLAS